MTAVLRHPLRALRVLLAVAVALSGVLVATPARANDHVGMPVLAYYYIWYTPTSWDRAKTDLPLLGRYSSDEISVMRAHAKEAKTAGIDGFLVSWKQTPVLDRRLALLERVAKEYGLKLGIVYQGLDFFRRPLPAARVASDLTWFADHYADDPVFDIQGRPLVIWSGTWEFTPRQVASVTTRVGDRVHVLASQRNAAEYRRVARWVDGDAYYWSSLDPEVDIRAQEDLDALGRVVHASGGLWIPSVAPGFDARLIGGHRVVPRRDGETLREEWRLAVGSSPDAVGLVSWNEFSENSHLEPSRRYGNQGLRTLAAILAARVPDIIAADSSDPVGDTPGEPVRAGLLLLVAFGVVLASLAAVARRRGRASGDGSGGPGVPGPDGDAGPGGAHDDGDADRMLAELDPSPPDGRRP